jgi:integrase
MQMIVTVYTRHSADCAKRNDSQWKRCKCPKWHYSLAWPRPQRSAKTRSWEEAELRARALEKGDRIPELSVSSTADAIKAYLADIESRNLSENYRAKLKRELNDLSEWAKKKPVPSMKHWNLQLLEEFRGTWTAGAVTRRKRQERLRSFFLYCINHDWIQNSPAKRLSRIKVDTVPTDYFTREEFDKIMKTVDEYAFPVDTEKKRAQLRGLVLLMRWSGLRLGDAVRLERARVVDGKLMLYTQKTGTPVYVPLPKHVISVLEAVPAPNPRYFFWSADSATKDNAGDPFWRWLEKIFKAAKIGKPAHPHMLRDTVAVELLLAGVPLDQVSILLGHSSVKITEKHYSPWVKARQEQLEQSVCKAWMI